MNCLFSSINLINNYSKSNLIFQVMIIDFIPLLNNGKVDRQALLKRYAENGGKPWDAHQYK